MDQPYSPDGLNLAARFAYPPNSFHLCGPEKQKELLYYYETNDTDKGLSEILSEFTTLYPYLTLIASSNSIKDPFDPRVVEAYWIGNSLLDKVPIKPFVSHLSETLNLRKKVKRKKLETILDSVTQGGLPHHSFHVANIYLRTGNIPISHTIESMDACIINSGIIVSIFPSYLEVTTQPLVMNGKSIVWGERKIRKISKPFLKGKESLNLKIGDTISYHWGHYCTCLTKRQEVRLRYYTNLSINRANKSKIYE